MHFLHAHFLGDGKKTSIHLLYRGVFPFIIHLMIPILQLDISHSSILWNKLLNHT